MTTTIEFYKIYHVSPKSDTPTIQECLKSLVGLPNIYNDGDLPRDIYNLSNLSNDCIGGVFRKTRPDDTIEYGQVGSDGTPLSLADDEGIFETNHFVYFPQYDIIGYVRNKHANHYSQLRACLSSLMPIWKN